MIEWMTCDLSYKNTLGSSILYMCIFSMKKKTLIASIIRYIGMVSTTDRDITEKLGITLPISLLKQIDNKRGDIPRSMFIRLTVESYVRGSRR
jgi:hypothetical protein